MACPSGEISDITSRYFSVFHVLSLFSYCLPSLEFILHDQISRKARQSDFDFSADLSLVSEVFSRAFGMVDKPHKERSLALNLITILRSFSLSRLSQRRWSDKTWWRGNFKGANKSTRWTLQLAQVISQFNQKKNCVVIITRKRL